MESIIDHRHQENIKKANQYYHTGCFQQAREICLRMLEIYPEHGESLSLLGGIAYGERMLDSALAFFERAARVSPGNGFHAHNLGVVTRELGRLEESASYYKNALSMMPDHAESWFNLADVLESLGRIGEAINCYEKAVSVRPDYGGAWNSMGILYSRMNRPEYGLNCFSKAIEIEPLSAKAHNNMGNVLRGLGRLEAAIAAFNRAIEIEPRYASAYNNRGVALTENGRFGAAMSDFRKAVEIVPDNAGCYSNMGSTFRKQGRVKEALACHRKAMEIDPTNTDAHCSFIFTLQYDPEIEGEALLAECMEWDRRHGSHEPPLPHENTLDPERRLRVGYISPDFSAHAVSFILAPLLSAHDKRTVEVFCYAEVARPDAFTELFRDYADNWRVTVGISDKDLDAIIRKDRIDILVDYGGYSSNNRLKSLTLKPAPIQVSTLFGHGGATGLKAFDYVLTDRYLTPNGFERHFSEQAVRLSHHVAPFRPLPHWPEASSLPAARNGKVVFGCFASPDRISQMAISLWCRILSKVPGSRLLLKNPAFSDPDTRRLWAEAFPPLRDRVDIEDVPGGWGRNMDVYSRVDILLDSLPVSGHTSTLIPLWMGLPVVSFSGRHARQRFGTSILYNIGLADLVAENGDSYVQKAARLGGDLDRLIRLRGTLRERVAASPLCHAQGIAREIEDVYRKMWRAWCTKMEKGPTS
jgi:protein O-GlcNAc transferase